MNQLQRLAADQIQKHGKDRYPTVHEQLLKLVSEVGELADAWLKYGSANQMFESELCDVALSLGALANKTGHDLDLSVNTLVGNDNRTFNGDYLPEAHQCESNCTLDHYAEGLEP